jgi:hypothetical protein
MQSPLGNHKANLAAIMTAMSAAGIEMQEGETFADALGRTHISLADHQALQKDHDSTLTELQTAQATLKEKSDKLAVFESALGSISTPPASAPSPKAGDDPESQENDGTPDPQESAENPPAPSLEEQVKDYIAKAGAQELLKVGITAVELAPNGEDDEPDPQESETPVEKVNRLFNEYAAESDSRKSEAIYQQLCKAREELAAS